MTSSPHPWSTAWSALSPQRRTALWGRVVDREPVADLAVRLGRSEADTEALVASTLLAFRREVVLGIGTGYAEECGTLVLRAVDSAGERLSRAERKALALHADSCPECARAVGELLELDARLRDGMLGLEAPGSRPAPLDGPVAGPSVPAPRQEAQPDRWGPAFDRLSPERRTALVHGAAGAEPPGQLAERLGTTEPAARDLAASSVLAFRQTVLRGLPVGSTPGCEVVAAHRTEDIALDGPRVKALRAHAADCAECAPTVAEILSLQTSLRSRVAALALGEQATTWLRARPRRTWVPGVERPTEPGQRRRLVVGAGLAVTAVTAVALVGAARTVDAPVDVVLAAPPAAAAEVTTPEVATPSVEVADPVVVASEQPVLSAERLSQVRPVVAVDAPLPSVDPSAPDGAPVDTADDTADDPPLEPGADEPDSPEGPGVPGSDPAPDDEADVPPLDVSVDPETGSVTLTVGLLGEPIVLSTPPIALVNNR